MPPRLLLPFLLLLGAASAAPLELGANFNENLHAARVPALDAGHARWIRGFLPVGEFVSGPRRLETDPGVATFRAAAASGRKIALTLKWDFKRSRWRVPAPDSDREKACFAWTLAAVRHLRPDLLLLVNEIFIDTEEADTRPGPDGAIPVARLLQRLAAHVQAARLTTPDGAPLPVGCGGFTRLHAPVMQHHPLTRALLPWLAASPHLTHVNFHLHHATLAEFDTALAFLRRHIPDRPLVVTEFSRVQAYRAHLADRLDATPAGREFAVNFGRDPTQTVADFLSAAARQPVSEKELHAFLRSQSWFDPEFLERACGLMERYGVTLATYAYLQEASGLERAGRALSPDQPPWRLNPIFQERHARVPDSDRLATAPGFFETFVRRQRSPSP